MKDKIIKFIKKNPFLYNLGKKVNQILNKTNKVQKNNSDTIYYTYILDDENELETIKEHYKNNRKDNTKLLIINTNPENKIKIHFWMRNNLDISFADINYFKKYKTKMLLEKMELVNYKNDNVNEILSYIK